MGDREKAFIFRFNDYGDGPDIVEQAFLEQGWVEFDEDIHKEHEWNFWWRTSRFRHIDYERLQPWQRLNHYPKCTSLTRKDGLVRNYRRMQAIHGKQTFNFAPIGFNLPNDYTRFVTEYAQIRKENGSKDVYWICKPADMSRGRGISVFHDLSDLQYNCTAVVQQYIPNPLLISGYKFDIRIYVLVPTFQPLRIYIYQEGLVRFSTEKYDLSKLDNVYSHLTNSSINKNGPMYSVEKERIGYGCKWTLTQLRHYLEQNNLDDGKLFPRIINIITLTLLMQASQSTAATNCFELYGFDVMIDENIKPWLLEVNFSPALAVDCDADILVKKHLIIDIVNMMGFIETDMDHGGEEFKLQQENIVASSHRSVPQATKKSKAPLTKTKRALNPLLPSLDKLTEGQSSQLYTVKERGRHGSNSDRSPGTSLVSEFKLKYDMFPGSFKCAPPSRCDSGHSSVCSGNSDSEDYGGYKLGSKYHSKEWRQALRKHDNRSYNCAASSDPEDDEGDLRRREKPLDSGISTCSSGSSERWDKNGISQSSSSEYISSSSRYHYTTDSNEYTSKMGANQETRHLTRAATSDKLNGSSRRNRRSYDRPWRKSQPVVEEITPECGKINTDQVCGNFVLIYPFNEFTAKYQKLNVDQKPVVRECQRFVKFLIQENAKESVCEARSPSVCSNTSASSTNVTQSKSTHSLDKSPKSTTSVSKTETTQRKTESFTYLPKLWRPTKFTSGGGYLSL